MDERQEPSLFGGNAKPAGDGAATDPGAAARRRRRGSSSGSSLVTNGILAITVALVALGTWFLLEQRMELMDRTDQLTEAQRRLSSLELRIRSTDEAAQAAESEANEQINFWEDEIRKLWDVSNKRNKRWIEDNRKAIENYKSNVGSAMEDLAGVKSAISRHEVALEQQEEIIRRLNAVNEQFDQILANHEALVEKMSPVADVVASFDSRLKENEEAIAAFDSYRARVNGQILELQQQQGSAPFPNRPGG